MALGWLWWRDWTGISRRWRHGTLRGRRGTWWRAPSFHVAGAALGDIYLRFAWQAWHLVTSTFVSRGRPGTYGTGLAGRLDPPSLTRSFTHHFVTHHFTHHFVTHHLSHTIFDTPSFTHHFVTHNLWHTIFHTPLCHTPSLSPTIFQTPSFTHNFVTHHLSHTSQTILHTPLCHTPSFTHNFVTHHFSTHNLSHTTLSHTIFRHTIFHTHVCHTQLCHTFSFTHNFHTHHLSHTTLSHALFHTHHLSHTTLSRTHHLSLSHTIFHIQLCHTQLCFTSRSSTTSFVFPSFPVPATTFGAQYWKKLPCGAIRSFNLPSQLSEVPDESHDIHHRKCQRVLMVKRSPWKVIRDLFARYWSMNNREKKPIPFRRSGDLPSLSSSNENVL